MYNNTPGSDPSRGGASGAGRTPARAPRSPNTPQAQQLGGNGIVQTPLQAAEQRARLTALQKKKRQEEREERERIEKARQEQSKLFIQQQHEKNVEAAKKQRIKMEQARQKQVRDTWDKRASNLPKPPPPTSRSRSHQPDPLEPPGLSPPQSGLSALERMDEEAIRKGLPPKYKNKKFGHGGAIVDDDEEMQRALAESLRDFSAKPSHQQEVHNVDYSPDIGYDGTDDEDRDLQKALMMSAAGPPAPSTTTTPTSHTLAQTTPTSRTTHTTYTTPNSHTAHSTYTSSHNFPGSTATHATHTYQQTFTSTAQPHAPPPVVHDVDGDVDMDLSSDPELQDALMRSLEPAPEQTQTQQQTQPKTPAQIARDARIFGTGQAEKPRVYSVEDNDGNEVDDDDYVEDPELRDAMRLSREVIDVDQNGGSGGDFGGQVEDYPSPGGAGERPVITDDISAAGGEDEDMELQRALMQSLNPNASPILPAKDPERVARRPPPRYVQQPPEDPTVTHARRIRNEQDWAYKQSLAEDVEKERKANEELEKARIQKEKEEQEAKIKEMEETTRRENRDRAGTLLPPEPKEGQGITIGIRMPNGTRFMRRFNPTDTLKDLRNFIESKANESNLAKNYEITSDFPKKTFHDLPVENTLAEAGINGRMLLNLLEK